jgi:hypothetical protein
VLVTGVMGVLDGRGPGSIGRTGNDLDVGEGEDGSVELLLPTWSPSSSSIGGKFVLKSEYVNWDMDVRGDEAGEDDGDGGPNDEGETNS